MSATTLAATIESTLLKPEATAQQIEALCREAAQLSCFGVCIAPAHVALAAEMLRGSPLAVVTVVGFPLGNQTTRTKTLETEELIALGATEIDVVINVGWVREGRFDRIQAELEEVRKATGGNTLKVILETGLLSPAQLDGAARAALDAGADFLKTSTGYGPRGASVEDVHFLAKVAEGRAGVKAAGGIRDRGAALALVGAGAGRIGTSAAGTIVKG
jgi:deoxyribose-phosphate aldolase